MDIINLLDEEFLEKKGLIKIEIQEKLYSKKNNLFKIRCFFKTDKYGPLNGSLFVFKQYSGIAGAERKKKETFMLNALGRLQQSNKKYQNLLVPELFCEGKDHIITYFISGETLLDYAERSENEKSSLANGNISSFLPFKNCIDWIIKFHAGSKKLAGKSCILNDINLRNFIICSRGWNAGKIYRLDFEDWGKGCIEKDLGKLIAFILTYDPMFTEWKIKLSGYVKKYIVEELKVNSSDLETEIEMELEEMASRRKISQKQYSDY